MLSELDAFRYEIAGYEPEAALEALIANHLPDSHYADWQLYNSVWTLAAYDDAYADMVIGIMNRWSALIDSIVRAGVQQGIYREISTARITRIIAAAVNGYADILSVNPSGPRCQEAKEDLRYLLQQLLSRSY
ncbi:TetR family transcriptional regulator C-terminal domain-containing protein [Xenorhabdus littoralis]|nr:TetR family transcriptional regulator C-terminal domain-containing protein [Xenorhabdus sp. Reich]